MGMTLDQYVEKFLFGDEIQWASIDDHANKTLSQIFEPLVAKYDAELQKVINEWLSALYVEERMKKGDPMTRKELTELVESLYPNHDAEFRKSEVERLLKGKTVDGEKVEENDEHDTGRKKG